MLVAATAKRALVARLRRRPVRRRRRMRILVVVDECTRECLALVPDTSISGIRVARELDRLLADRGKPKMVVSDNVLRREIWHPEGQQASIH
jgi:putative transposase